MTDIAAHVDDAKRQINRKLREAAPFIEKVARIGIAARGSVYVLLGTLAALSAIGWGGETVGPRGALRHLWREPFGLVLLIGIAAGLACYAMWLAVRAIKDPENERQRPWGNWRRFGIFCSVLVNLALTGAAIGLVVGVSRSSSSDVTVDWTKTIMSYPLGRWVTAGIGIGVIVYGVCQVYLAYRCKLDRRLSVEKLSTSARKSVLAIGVFGMASRGIVYALTGTFLIFAAWYNNPNEARGLGGTLRALSMQAFGAVLLGVTATGLIAFGIYQFILALYRRIRPV